MGTHTWIDQLCQVLAEANMSSALDKLGKIEVLSHTYIKVVQ